MPLVTFVMGGGVRAVEAAGSVLDAAHHGGIPLASSCRGVGVCDACRVRVLDGAANLGAPTALELRAGLAADERLACQTCVSGPATVTTRYW